MIRPLLLLASIATAGALHAAPARAAGLAPLGAAATRSLSLHPDVASRRAAWEAQLQAWDAARGARLPRLDLAAQGGRERVAAPTGGGGSVGVTGASHRASVVARQPLFDGGELSAEAERQGRLANVRLFDLRDVEDRQLQELVRAWVDVLRQRELAAIGRESVQGLERLAELVGSKTRAGLSRGVDLEQAAARVASSRLALAGDEANLREAVARYARVAQSASADEVRPLELPAAGLPAAEPELLERVLAYAPAARSAGENAALVDAEVRLRRSAFAPKTALEVRHDIDARTPLIRDAAGSSLMLTLNLNVFAGGADTARQRDAELRRDSARHAQREALAAAGLGARLAWSDALKQASLVTDAATYADAIARARVLYQSQYEIGQRSLLDLLNSEGEVAQARRVLANARHDALLARLRLLVLSGGLDAAAGIARPPAEPALPPATASAGIGAPPSGVDPAVASAALPEALAGALNGWVRALVSGRQGATRPWYEPRRGDDAPVSVGERLDVLEDLHGRRPAVTVRRVERTDDRGPDAGVAQLSLLSELSDAAGVRHLRTAQQWVRVDGQGWMIRAERTVPSGAADGPSPAGAVSIELR